RSRAELEKFLHPSVVLVNAHGDNAGVLGDFDVGLFLERFHLGRFSERIRLGLFDVGLSPGRGCDYLACWFFAFWYGPLLLVESRKRKTARRWTGRVQVTVKI